MTQAGLATVFGVSPQAVSQWKTDGSCSNLSVTVVNSVAPRNAFACEAPRNFSYCGKGTIGSEFMKR